MTTFLLWFLAWYLSGIIGFRLVAALDHRDIKAGRLPDRAFVRDTEEAVIVLGAPVLIGPLILGLAVFMWAEALWEDRRPKRTRTRRSPKLMIRLAKLIAGGRK